MVYDILKSIDALDSLTIDEMNVLTEAVYKKSEMQHNPVANVKFVPLEKIQPNDYNPNAVAKQEMKLLYSSISHDGYTQPIVTIYDESLDKYIIVDGFHRYYVMNTYTDINDLNKGYAPVVVIDKGINERMASTVRHNRARGKHSLTGMGNIVNEMLMNGMEDDEICNTLGLEPDELIRLKHTSGVAKLFEDSKFSKVGKPDYQLEREYDPTNPKSKPIEDGRFKNVKVD